MSEDKPQVVRVDVLAIPFGDLVAFWFKLAASLLPLTLAIALVWFCLKLFSGS